MRSRSKTAVRVGSSSILVAALWMTATPALKAQDCPDAIPYDWQTSEWWVRCGPDVIDKIELYDLLIANDTYTAPQCDDTSTTGVAAATRSELEAASVWLESLCFRSPDVPMAVRDGQPARTAWVSQDMQELGNQGIESCELGGSVDIDKHKPDSLGVYVCRNIFVDFTSFFAMGEDESDMKLDIPNTGTMVHELFHAIQARYPLSNANSPYWITEGTADAVMVAWLQQEEDLAMSERARAWDAPLHRPVSKIDAYRTHLWWGWLGVALESPGRIGYLADLLLDRDFEQNDGLADLEEWLKTRDTDLYTLYPEFTAQVTTQSAYFSDTHEETIRYREDETVEEEHEGNVREIAAEAVQLKTEVPAGESAELTIRIRPDQEALHLAVGKTNYSTPDGTMTIDPSAGNYRWDARDAGWAEARNTFRTVVVGGDSPQEFLTRVTNVEREPVDTEPSDFRLEFELKPFGECQFSASLTGDTTSSSANGRVAQFSTRGGATSTGMLSNPETAQGMAAMLEQFAGDRITDEERAELRAGAEQWQREAAQMPTETLGINLIEMNPGAGGASNLASALGGFRLSASVFDQPIEPGFRGALEPGLVFVQTGDFDLAATAQTRFEWAPGEPGSASIIVNDYRKDQLAGTINAVLEAAGVKDPNTGEPLRIHVSANFLARRHDPLGGLIACLPGG